MAESEAVALGEHGPPAPPTSAPGARWWSLDIHAHSPASFDYGGLPDLANKGQKPTYQEWIQAYLDAGVDGIVVTDHNTHDGIDQAREAINELRADDPALPPLVIFPGVELTVTGGTHVLGIFDPSCPAETVNQVLTLCRYKGTRGDSNQTANITISDAAKIVHDNGGLFVPAHADGPRGVFGIEQRDLHALKGDPHIQAVEVIEDGRIEEANRSGWAALLGSDAHHLNTDSHTGSGPAKAPGTHVTLVKAETLDLHGLRLAISDATESIQRCVTGYEDPNEVDRGHIDSIEIIHGGATETFRFGPWMNCLIGGRGVGKSTVIELLRLALGRTDELPPGVARDLARFMPIGNSDERWWDERTRITVQYTRDGRPLRVNWHGSEPGRSTIEVWDGSEWEEQAGRTFDRTPVRVFSQKQIYELASRTQSFLTILDDMPSIRRAEWDEEIDSLQLQFKAERNKLRQLLAESEKADRIRGELEQVQGRLRHLQELRASDEYKELEKLEVQLRQSAVADERAAEIEQLASDQARTLRELTTDALRVDGYVDRSAKLARAAGLLEEAAALLGESRTQWDASSTLRQWQSRVSELNGWLGKQGGSSRVAPDKTLRDRERETELQAELRTVENSDERRATQQGVIDGILEAIVEKRHQLFERRQAFVKSLSASDGSLTEVEVFHQGDAGSLGSALRKLLKCADSFDSAFAKDGFASFLSGEPKDPKFPDRVVGFKTKLIELVEEGSSSEIGRAVPVDARFYSRLAKTDTFDMVTDIMLWFPDDLVSVRYRTQETGNFVPVDRGSPGQKTAALLTVILQMGTDPLLLDQPEDDLENKLIRHLAVETLKSIKSKRQLIVSTHNANVVVTSGAENVVVVQHGNAIPGIEAAGTLQQAAVKDNVCEILEGGEDAIKTRYQRLVGPLHQPA